jgi:hypothetical protein
MSNIIHSLRSNGILREMQLGAGEGAITAPLPGNLFTRRHPLLLRYSVLDRLLKKHKINDNYT